MDLEHLHRKGFNLYGQPVPVLLTMKLYHMLILNFVYSGFRLLLLVLLLCTIEEPGLICLPLTSLWIFIDIN